MRRLLLVAALASFWLGALWGCSSRSDEPVTVRHRFFDTKNRVPPKPNDVDR
jgi:hypothetical protein